MVKFAEFREILLEYETFKFGLIRYDVDKAKRWIRANRDKVKITNIPTKDLVKWLSIRIKDWKKTGDKMGNLMSIGVDPEKAEKTKFSAPVILVDDPDLGGSMVIDGWHRIAMADYKGWKHVPAYHITDPEVVKSLKN